MAAFAPASGCPAGRCPRCGARERHRLLWLYLDANAGLLADRPRVLHFAPEHHLSKRLRRAAGHYVSADLDADKADLACDLETLPFADAEWDLIICSHVLEHVAEDRRALSEMRRVLAPGGTALLLVPIDDSRETTYEDSALTTPEERSQAFWQHDHVRLYGTDFAERVADAGFSVEQLSALELLGDDRVARFGLIAGERVFAAHRST